MSVKPDAEADRSNLLSVNELSIYYESIQATWDVSFSVKERSITALVGSNGAGKTAIMKSICGVLPHERGTIRYQDKIIDKMPPYQRVEQGISLIPEGRKLFPFLTVRENLEIGAFPKRARKRLDQTVEEVYQLFPILAKRTNQLAVTLSGGEQQMLAIGRALMTNPTLLLMDEPSEGLAPIVLGAIRDRLLALKGPDLSILLVEQNLGLALSLADRIVIMGPHGQLVWTGTPPELERDEHAKKTHLGV